MRLVRSEPDLALARGPGAERLSAGAMPHSESEDSAADPFALVPLEALAGPASPRRQRQRERRSDVSELNDSDNLNEGNNPKNDLKKSNKDRNSEIDGIDMRGKRLAADRGRRENDDGEEFDGDGNEEDMHFASGKSKTPDHNRLSEDTKILRRKYHEKDEFNVDHSREFDEISGRLERSASTGSVYANEETDATQAHEIAPVLGSATGFVKQFLSAASLPADVNMYIPEFVKTYAAGGEASRADACSREKVISVALENLGGRRVAVLGYESGFQVWRLGVDGEAAKELTSVRHGGVRLCHCLADPPQTRGSTNKFDGVRPLLALVPTSNRDRKHEDATDVVRIFSVGNQKVVHKLPMNDRVMGLQSSTCFFAVATRKQIVIFNASNFEEHHVIKMIAPPPGVETSFALSHRWIAYVDTLADSTYADDVRVWKDGQASGSTSGSAPTSSALGIPSPRTSATESGINWSSSVKGAAKDLASGLYYLGDLGLRKLDEKRNGTNPDKVAEANQMRQAKSEFELAMARYASAGVVVRDLQTQTVIASFKSHNRPVGRMCFDPTGSLLVVCSLDGQAVHVHKILPQRSSLGSKPSHRLLYRLSRGITRAVIRDISFSEDLRWLAVTSARGTTHMFAICPAGGTPSTLTHRTVNQTAGGSAFAGTFFSTGPSSSLPSSVSSGNGESRVEGWRIRERFASFSSSLTNGSPPSILPSPLSSSLGSSTSTLMSTVSTATNATTTVSPVFPAFTDLSRGSASNPTPHAPIKLAALVRIRQNVSSLSTLLSESRVQVESENASQDSSSVISGSTVSGQDEIESRIPACACASFHGNSLYLLSGAGLLQQYKLIPLPNEKDHRGLELKAVASSTWDICRRDHWRTFTKPSALKPKSASFSSWGASWSHAASSMQGSQPNEDAEKQAERQRLLWLSNVEIYTHASPITHIWAAPQFQFATYDQDAALSSNAKLFIERANSTTVPVRGAGPTPTFASSSKRSPSKRHQDQTGKPSSPTADMHVLRNAIDTPAEFQDLYIADEQELDGHIMVFDDDMGDDMPFAVDLDSSTVGAQPSEPIGDLTETVDQSEVQFEEDEDGFMLGSSMFEAELARPKQE